MNLLTGTYLAFALNVFALIMCLVSTVLNIIQQDYIVAVSMAILVAVNVYIAYINLKRINSIKEDML